MDGLLVLNGFQLKRLWKMIDGKEPGLAASIMRQIEDYTPGAGAAGDKEKFSEAARLLVQKKWLYDEQFETGHSYLNMCIVALAWLMPDLQPITDEIEADLLREIIPVLPRCGAEKHLQELWKALINGRWLSAGEGVVLNPRRLLKTPYYGYLTDAELDYFVHKTSEIKSALIEAMEPDFSEALEDVLYACEEAVYEERDVMSIVS
ncbi:MAG: hypothetical protein ACM3WV_00275 [Bacillota bacterium]